MHPEPTDRSTPLRFTRRAALLAGLAAVLLGFGTLQEARAQTPIPSPQPPRGSLAGLPPQGEGIALLTTTDEATAASLTATLGDAGCMVETISVLRPRAPQPQPLPPQPAGDWTPFIAGAPAAANEGFVRTFPTIPANTPFFLRCRSGMAPAVDPANARYRIGTTVVTLVNGRADVEAAPGSASRMITTLTDRQSFGDLDGGTADAAVVLAHSPGGSGTFSYLAVQSGGTGSAGIGATALLGDRVTVTGVSIANGRVLVTYLTHRPAEALAAAPTLPVTKVFTLTGGALVEVGSIVG
jgi:hypothetical protein